MTSESKRTKGDIRTLVYSENAHRDRYSLKAIFELFCNRGGLVRGTSVRTAGVSLGRDSKNSYRIIGEHGYHYPAVTFPMLTNYLASLL